MVVITRQFDLQRELELEVSRGALSAMSKKLKKRDDISSDDRGENDNHHHGSSDDHHDDDRDDDGDDDGENDDDDEGGSHHSATHIGTSPGIYTGMQGTAPATTTVNVGGNPVPTSFGKVFFLQTFSRNRTNFASQRPHHPTQNHRPIPP
jgi:hypothetical protein